MGTTAWRYFRDGNQNRVLEPVYTGQMIGLSTFSDEGEAYPVAIVVNGSTGIIRTVTIEGDKIKTLGSIENG